METGRNIRAFIGASLLLTGACEVGARVFGDGTATALFTGLAELGAGSILCAASLPKTSLISEQQ